MCLAIVCRFSKNYIHTHISRSLPCYYNNIIAFFSISIIWPEHIKKDYTVILFIKRGWL